MTLRRVENEIADLLRQQRQDDAPLRPMRIDGRNPDGTIRERPLDGECVRRGPIYSAYTGQILERSKSPAFNARGAAGIPVASSARAIATLFVERLVPDTYEPGGVYSVLVEGFGFKESFLDEFLLANGTTINDDITIHSLAVIDDETAEMVIEVNPGATLTPQPWPLAYDNVGEPN